VVTQSQLQQGELLDVDEKMGLVTVVHARTTARTNERVLADVV